MNFDSSVLQVAVEDIIPNRFQPRLVFEDKSLQELSESIKQHGIIQPLVLRRIGDKYEIIAGERRYKAATMAGLASVPAVISQADDKTSAEAAVVENVQRKDLSAVEEARSYKALLDQGYMSQEQLARKMGLSQSAISNKLRLLTLPDEIQTAVMENKISERHARSLLKIKDTDEQISLMNRIISERLTVRQLDEIIKETHPTGVQEVNIAEVREKAEDINPPTEAAPIEEVKQEDPFKKGAINLGQRQQNRFFNTLEAESANMQMTEAVNPFDGFENNESPFAGTTTVDTQVNKAEEIAEQKDIQFSATEEQVLGSAVEVGGEDLDNEVKEEPVQNNEPEVPQNDEPQDIFPKEELTPMAEAGISPTDIPKIDANADIKKDDNPINSFSNIFNGVVPEAPSANSESAVTPEAPAPEPPKVDPIDLIVTPKPEPTEEIEMLDTLDFEPPKKEIDLAPVVDKINTVINEIRNENYKIDSIKTDLADQITFTITIKKEN